MKNNHQNFLKPLVLLLIAVVFASLVFVFVNDGRLFNCCQPDRYNFSNSPMADWKTYTNENYGFEFKYPDRYEIGGDRGVVYLSPVIESACCFFDTAFHLSIEKTKKEIINPKDFIIDRRLGYDDSYVIQTILVGGQESLRVDYAPVYYSGDGQGEGEHSSLRSNVFFIKDNFLYSIDIEKTIEDLERGKDLDQILSTFKFVK